MVSAGRSPQGGFTYLGLLFLVVVMGLGLTALAQVWQTTIKRQKEQELLFVGRQFREAIASYYERSPDGVKQFPKRIEDLLDDKRFPTVTRHLRRIYADPMTGASDWVMIQVAGGIAGVHSRDPGVPLRTSNFSEKDFGFEAAGSYRDWKFAHALPEEVEVVPDSPAQHEIPQVAEAQPQPPDRSDECNRMRWADSATCSKAGRSHGQEALDRCAASLLARRDACLAGMSLPPLESSP